VEVETVQIWVPTQRVAELLTAAGLAPGVELEVVDAGAADPDALPASAATVEGLVTPMVVPPGIGAVLRRLPRLRVVQAQNAGVERIVREVPEGVLLYGARGVPTPATAEWVCAVVLAMVRELPRFAEQAARHVWETAWTGTLEGATVLVVGAGSIGEAVEARLTPFGARFLRVARRARPGVAGFEQLPELVGQADVVVIAVPLTAATRRLVDADFLARLRPGALLVNVARGPVVDTDALVEHLRAGRGRAALDVTDPEPLPVDHPLWDAPNLLLTPHVAGSAASWEPRFGALVAPRLSALARGEVPEGYVTEGY
jgi:phosphoglycerate dehydrogenase-like enzyme